MAEYDIVVLTIEIPELGLRSGDVGTVVMDYRVFQHDASAVEVEFTRSDGTTTAIATVPINRLRMATKDELNELR